MGILILSALLFAILYAVAGAVFAIGVLKIILLACGVFVLACVIIWVVIIALIAIISIFS